MTRLVRGLVFRVTGTGNCFFLIAGAGKTGIRCLQALISLRQKRRKKGKKTLLGTVQAKPESRHLRNSEKPAMRTGHSEELTDLNNLECMPGQKNVSNRWKQKRREKQRRGGGAPPGFVRERPPRKKSLFSEGTSYAQSRRPGGVRGALPTERTRRPGLGWLTIKRMNGVIFRGHWNPVGTYELRQRVCGLAWKIDAGM